MPSESEKQLQLITQTRSFSVNCVPDVCSLSSLFSIVFLSFV